MMPDIKTKYYFKCRCGREKRLNTPDRVNCDDCGEPMEFNAVMKIYPGFGIGRLSVRSYFQYGDPHKELPPDADLNLGGGFLV